MKTKQLRQTFLEYFSQHGHEVVPSSPLIPANDPTLLFTNAGMVQFKETFLGIEQRAYTRATSSQCCVRAGGKHNDLENVGYTARHHTFFEMLGNFSFGDYFKREAIQYAWTFLTEVLKLPAEKLWVTVFEDDDEAADIWLKEIKVDPQRFSRCGEEDNFWAMGDTGPCGPCTEIFYDHGAEIAGGPPGTPEADGDRYVEIWNLVFMQYNRDNTGKLTPLPKPSVDTGMGLERIAAVMQGVHSNYHIDTFQHLIQAIKRLSPQAPKQEFAFNVVADHIRSSSFLIADGVQPSNEGRGYVLRRIIRRAVYHGHYHLGMTQPFFYQLVNALVAEMGGAYPRLQEKQAFIEQTLLREEQQFLSTLNTGIQRLQQWMAQHQGQTIIPGDVVFELYDTHGIPLDVTQFIAKGGKLEVDVAGYEKAMATQRERSRQASHFQVDYSEMIVTDAKTIFTGYDKLEDSVRIVAIYQQQQSVQSLSAGEKGLVMLDSTPFYAESGGQVGDIGTLNTAQQVCVVENTSKVAEAFLHHVNVKQGVINVGDNLHAKVDAIQRNNIKLNHSATHLLHAALRYVLGDSVQQKGSLVAADRLRFDFSHYQSLTPEELFSVERLINEKIRDNYAVQTEVMDMASAKQSGAMALFGEKYADDVRVLSMGDFSKELCGGTHVEATGEIGLFKIISESGIATGVRRIEAVTGEAAIVWVRDTEQHLQQIQQMLKANRDNLLSKLQQQQQQVRSLEKQLMQLQAKVASRSGDELSSKAFTVQGVQVLAEQLEGADSKVLRDTLDQLKNKLQSAIIVLASVQADKVLLIAGVTKDLTSRFKAGELVNSIATQVGGRGGGRADMAQAGGTQPEHLPQALASVKSWIAERS
jgi:alanyl-tRNA synthetase